MTPPTLITSRLCGHLLAILSYTNDYFYIANFSLQINDYWTTKEIRTFIQSLKLRTTQGLDTRFLLASPPSMARLTARNTASSRFVSDCGIPLHFYSGPAVLHAKFAVADDIHLIVGSHNLSHNSLHRNVELSLHVEDPAAARAAKAIFLGLWETSKSR